MSHPEVVADQIHRFRHLCQAHTGRSSANRLHPCAGPRAEIELGIEHLGGTHGQPDADRQHAHRPLESSLRHAYHGEGVTVESDGPTDNRRVGAKQPAPRAVTQNHNRLRTRSLILFGQEEPAQLRSHTEHIEEVVRDKEPDRRFWIGLGADYDGSNRRTGQMDHSVGTITVVTVGRVGKVVVRLAVLVNAMQPHDFAGVSHTGGWSQEYRIHHTEDRRGGRYAERNRERGDQGEPGCLSQEA